jgi:hypothetical protein
LLINKDVKILKYIAISCWQILFNTVKWARQTVGVGAINCNAVEKVTGLTSEWVNQYLVK